MVRNDHHAALGGNVLLFASHHAVAEVEIFQHLVDELHSLQLVALCKDDVEFPFTQQFLENSDRRPGDEVVLTRKRGIFCFQQLFNVDHAHIANLRLPRDLLDYGDRMCQIHGVENWQGM